MTIYRRGEGEAWTREFLSDPEAVLTLSEIECALPLGAIYERVS